jgi:hypothetical protein
LAISLPVECMGNHEALWVGKQRQRKYELKSRCSCRRGERRINGKG